MTNVMQRTLSKEINISGVGLHSGKIVNMKLVPASENQGIVFVRTDFKSGKGNIPALWDRVTDTQLCTLISNEHGASVGTIEHLMSALRGCGIDNLTVELDGIEVPIMDGSAMPFVKAIEKAGTKIQYSTRRMIRVLREVGVSDGDKTAILRPASISSFVGEIEFPHKEIGKQSYNVQLVNGNFAHDIAQARTFGFYEQVQWLRQHGKGLGGSLENAIVLDSEKILNPEGLRFNNEFIRHKILDAIGDTYLAGGHILGQYEGIKAGHAINNALLHELFSSDLNWEFDGSARANAA